jgi:hypothetical protein
MSRYQIGQEAFGVISRAVKGDLASGLRAHACSARRVVESLASGASFGVRDRNEEKTGVCVAVQFRSALTSHHTLVELSDLFFDDT